MMASIALADDTPATVPQPVRRLAWVTRLLAPVAIVAVVIAFAIGIRNRSRPLEVVALDSPNSSAKSEDAAAPAPQVAPQPAEAPIAQPMGDFRKSESAQDSSAKSSSVAGQNATVESARAIAAPAGAGAAKLLATEPPPNQISSPDGSVMWQFGARGVSHALGNSRPWLPMHTGATADILAASAPSNDVAG